MLGMRQYIRDVFDVTNTDKGHFHEYEHMYANIFSSFEPKSILEIGVRGGHSIRAWQKLFPNARVVGLDIKETTLIEGPAFEYVIGDSTDPAIAAKLGKFDLIIDDGSHHILDQILTFNNFKDSFNYAFVVEDISFARHPHPGSEHSIKVLMACIQKCGFRGIARFESYNKRNPSCSLVVQSNTF